MSPEQPDAPDSSSAIAQESSRAAGALVLGNVLATASEIVVPLIIVRIVGKSDVASLMALLLVYNTVALMLLTGFPQSVQFFLPGRGRSERAAIARKIITILLGLGCVAAVVLVGLGIVGERAIAFFSDADASEVTSLAPLMLVALFALGDLPARILPNLLVAERRPRSAAAYGVFRSLGISLSSLLPLALGYDVWVVAGCLVVLAAGQWVFLALQMRSLYRGSARVPSPVGSRELFAFGLPLGMTDIVSRFNSQFDRLLILFSFPGTGFAEYQAGAWQIPIVTAVPALVGTAIAPRMVERFKAGRPRDAIALWRESIGKVSLIVVPVTLVIAVAAEEVVELLFTAEYANAAGVLRWYALLSVGRVAAFGTVIVAAGRPKYVLQAALLSFASNAALSLPLLIFIGFEGPAMGTALAFIPMVVFYVWCIARASGIGMRGIFPLARYARVVGISLPGVAAALAISSALELSAGPSLLVQTVVVLGAFATVGTVTGTVTLADWRFAWEWVRLRSLKR